MIDIKNYTEEEITIKFEGLVCKIAKRFSEYNKNNVLLSFEDLKQLGYIGLITAKRTYNPDKNVKFITYATTVITNSILKQLYSEKISKSSNPETVKKYGYKSEKTVSINQANDEDVRNYYGAEEDSNYQSCEINDLIKVMIEETCKINTENQIIIKRGIYSLMLQEAGFTLKEIAEKTDLTIRKVHYSINRSKKILSKKYSDEDLLA